jgi:cytochrome c5
MTMKLLAAAAAIAGCGFFVLTGQQEAPPAVYTAAQATAGRAAFQRWCAPCHTETLIGRNDGNEPVPPLTGASFMAKWGGQTTKDLYHRIEGIEADPPGERTHLNILAYILQFNGAPPGTQALTRDTAVEIRSIAPGAGPQPSTAAPETGGGKNR